MLTRPSSRKVLSRNEVLCECAIWQDAALIITDCLQLVTLDPSNGSNRAAVRRLKPIVEERREKMKEEMIGEFATPFAKALSS